MKQTGMLVVVLLRGVNFRSWSRLGCSVQSANILSRQGLVQGSAKKHRITRREIEVNFLFNFVCYVFISLKLIACRICVFLSGPLQGSKFAYATPRLVSFRGHKKLEPCPDGLLQGLNSKFPTSIPVCFIWEYPPPLAPEEFYQTAFTRETSLRYEFAPEELIEQYFFS